MDYLGIAALITAFSGSGFLGLVIRNMGSKIDGLETSKQDKVVCVVSHAQIEKDAARGQKNFDSILESINSLKSQLAQNNTEISLLTQTIKSFAGYNRRMFDDHKEQ